MLSTLQLLIIQGQHCKIKNTSEGVNEVSCKIIKLDDLW
jgi:hypothetical protein